MAKTDLSKKLSGHLTDPWRPRPKRLSHASREMIRQYHKAQEEEAIQEYSYEEDEYPDFDQGLNERTPELNPAIFHKFQERCRTSSGSSKGSDDDHDKVVLRSSFGDQLEQKSSMPRNLLNNLEPNTADVVDGEKT